MRCFFLLLAAVLSGCTAWSPENRRENAVALAAGQGWQFHEISAGEFVLAAAYSVTVRAPLAGKPEPLAVYLEGDGHAWVSMTQASDDPTPVQHVALELALRHPGGRAAYLGRPCQYVRSPACATKYWTDARYANEVIQSSHLALTELKTRLGAERLILVGYSGGAAVAALLAAQRNDVDLLVSVAGNLDHAAWTRHHRVSPLRRSLNPVDVWRDLVNVPQVHWVGGQDTVVPAALVQAYADRFPAGRRPRIELLADFDHQCCWRERWPQIWAQTQGASTTIALPKREAEGLKTP